MNRTISQLRAACIPFVTRTFRGSRWNRTLLLSAVVAVLTVLTGLWIAQGRGQFEQDVRTELGVERSNWEREEVEYVVIVRDELDFNHLKWERDQVLRAGLTERPEYGQIGYMIEQGEVTLREAAVLANPPPQHEALQLQARALLEEVRPGQPWTLDGTRGFSWNDPRDIERLQNILGQRLVPQIELYRSPLDGAGTTRFVGFVAGAVLATLLLIAAPLLVGVQIAQEVHENTLQPVTGTSLSPRQLVIGLTSGPLAQVGVIAAPAAVVVLLTAAVAGAFVPALGFVALAAVVGVFSSMLTQLVGFGAGRRRTPGIIGIALLAILGGGLLAGTGIGFNLDREMVGLVTIVPQSGVGHLLREAFVPAERLPATAALELDLRLVFSGLAYAILAGVVLLALARRVAGRTAPTLRPSEAWVAVGTLIVAALLALPHFDNDIERVRGAATYLLTLGLLMMPLQFVLAGRVTVGDAPAALRSVPLRRYLGTFAGFLAAHLVVVSILIGGPQHLLPLSLGGLLHLGWALAVAALIAVRAVAVPLKPAGTIWTAGCLVMAMVEFGLGGVLFAERHAREHWGIFDWTEIMPFFELSPMLGLLHVAAMIWVPISLVRALKKGSAGLC